MANISQGSTENVVLGEGYSPWALNSNDLYPDSTSYIIGIGLADPDTALHIKDASNPQLKLEDGTNYATWQTAGDDLILNLDGGVLDNLTIEADTGKFIFKSNYGTNNTVTLNAANGWNYIPNIANTTLNVAVIRSGSAINAPTGIFFDWGRKEANASKTADYTAGQGDHVVFCDPTSGSMTITLPAATAGRVMRIKNTTTGLANTVTVATPASETIDGQASSVLSASYGTIELVANGTNWFILNVV